MAEMGGRRETRLEVTTSPDEGPGWGGTGRAGHTPGTQTALHRNKKTEQLPTKRSVSSLQREPIKPPRATH